MLGTGQGYSSAPQLKSILYVPGYCAAWGKALQDFLGRDEFGFSILYKAGVRTRSRLRQCCRQALLLAAIQDGWGSYQLLCCRLVKD